VTTALSYGEISLLVESLRLERAHAADDVVHRPERIMMQTGPQIVAASSSADFVLGGGAAGGGKTYQVLAEACRHAGNPDFGVVGFRRTYPQIINEGGMWDTASKIYRRVGAVGTRSSLEWRFPSGARVRFAHMQHEDDRYQWDGAQVPLFIFDQLEHFTRKQFFYMLARNRSTCGVRPYIRATCNPDPDHWLRKFIDWWIDPDTGYAIHERSGVVRWFLHLDDEFHWAATAEELSERFDGETPLSFTFVPSRVYDNKIMLADDPGYEAKLRSLSYIDRMRLLEGNWNIRETAGNFFRKEWFPVVGAAPALVDAVRYWDMAATPAEQTTVKRSWTAGVKMGVDANGLFWVTDVRRFQGSPLEVETAVKNTASADGYNVRIGIEQDPAQAGKAEAQRYARMLAGYEVQINNVREDKGKRAKPLSAQVEAGNVKVVNESWTDDYLKELENFDGSDKCVADQTDASSGAFYVLTRCQVAGTW